MRMSYLSEGIMSLTVVFIWSLLKQSRNPVPDSFSTYLPLGVRHCNSLKIHTASPVAWITSAFDSTFWAKACEKFNILIPKHKEDIKSRKWKQNISPDLNWILSFISLVGWDVKADLHEGDLCVIILVEFQSHLIFPSGTLGHVGKWNLKCCVFIYIKL